MTIRLPSFITFTGVDDSTAVSDLRMIRDRYPVEFGLLMSRDRQGKDPRYPRGPHRFTGEGLPIAIHLCGAYAREVMDFPYNDWEIPTGGANRVQINHAAPDIAAAQRFSQMIGKRVILQSRSDDFPRDHDVDWLYDCSGGRGVAPAAWPVHPGKLVGYAGGISPDNVMAAVEAIGGQPAGRVWRSVKDHMEVNTEIRETSGPYWLDMESGVRDENDQFSIEKVWAICETVYGRKI